MKATKFTFMLNIAVIASEPGEEPMRFKTEVKEMTAFIPGNAYYDDLKRIQPEAFNIVNHGARQLVPALDALLIKTSAQPQQTPSH